MENQNNGKSSIFSFIALGVIAISAAAWMIQRQGERDNLAHPIEAKYEAQKILAALTGQAGSAAFMDVALKNDDTYRRLFSNGLRPMIDSAPVGNPAFTPYMSCVESGRALLRFAELRRIAGRQSDESDAYRRPYWDALDKCKAAAGQ